MNRNYVLTQLKAGTRTSVVRGGANDGKHKTQVIEHSTDRLLAEAFDKDRETSIDMAIDSARSKAGIDAGPKSVEQLRDERITTLENKVAALEQQVSGQTKAGTPNAPQGDSGGGTGKGKPRPKPKAENKSN